MIEIATAINSLGIPQANDAQPASEEPIFVLTASQLKAIIEKAVQPLQNELSELKATVASQSEEIKALKLNEKLNREDIQDLIHDMDALEGTTPTKKTTDHIEDLHRLMTEERSRQISIAKAARLLGISKERMRQLKPLIMDDGRFEMLWDKVNGKKAVMVRLKRFIV